jgi:hypothetical protein
MVLRFLGITLLIILGFVIPLGVNCVCVCVCVSVCVSVCEGRGKEGWGMGG